MSATIGTATWLSAVYGIFLLGVAFGLDKIARRTATRTQAWRSGAFIYHEKHDAWVCQEDQWLWPHSFDPENRLMRYRASPTVCNGCNVKHACTTSDTGREISRNVDPWPSSEAERFHRGVACSVAVLGILWPLAMTIGDRTAAERMVLLAAAIFVAAGSWPLWSHLRRSPAAFPDHVKSVTLDEAAAAEAIAVSREARRRAGYRSDRLKPSPARAPQPAGTDAFATLWNSYEKAPYRDRLPGGWSKTDKR